MSSRFQTTIDDWSNGVITTTEADEIPRNASPHGENSTLVSEGAGRAVVAKRQGASVLHADALEAGEAIVGVHQYRVRAGSTYTTYYACITADGQIHLLEPDGDVVASATFSPFTGFPDFAVANNLLFFATGGENYKLRGTTLEEFGIEAPATAPTLSDGGSAGSHNGTYEAYVTFYNTNTGHESSAGPTSSTVTVANKTIAWSSIPTSSDTQVTARRLYIRNTATQTEFFRVATISDNTTTSTTTNVADSSLRIIGPDETENSPPPSGIRYLCWHKSRMFASDGQRLYYSKIGLPEAFDEEAAENVNPDDGQSITGLVAFQDLLWIFKDRATYVLNGDDPNTWSVDLVDPSVGCATHRSITITEGVLRLWSLDGPVEWVGNGFRFIGKDWIEQTISPEVLAFDQFHLVCAAADPAVNTILFAVPDAGATRNTRILPYNYRLGRWESTKWDPFDVSAMATMEDEDRAPWVFMGIYESQLLKWRGASNDGVASGTTSGTFVASGSSITSLTDADAAFDTDGVALAGRRVTILDANGDIVGVIRPRITANTGTALTFTPAVTGLSSGATYAYVVGGPAFVWDTLWEDSDAPWNRKRYRFINLHFGVDSADVMLRLNTFFDFLSSPVGAATLDASSFSAEAGVWDVSTWDNVIFGAALAGATRVRVGKVARLIKIRVANYMTDEDVTLHKIAIDGEVVGENIVNP